MTPDTKRLVLSNTKKYFERRGQELAARLTSLIDLLAQLEEGPSGQQLRWYQFIRRIRRWWNRERIANIMREIETVRNNVFENACAFTHLSTGNVAPALEILGNDEREFLSEEGMTGNRDKVPHVQVLRQCLKDIA